MTEKPQGIQGEPLKGYWYIHYGNMPGSQMVVVKHGIASREDAQFEADDFKREYPQFQIRVGYAHSEAERYLLYHDELSKGWGQQLIAMLIHIKNGDFEGQQEIAVNLFNSILYKEMQRDGL